MKTKYILFGIFLTTFIASCNNCMKGSGVVVTSIRPTAPFTDVVSNGDFNVYLTQSSAHEVKIITDDNIVPYVETHVNNGVLTLSFKDNTNIRRIDRLDIYVSAPIIGRVNLEGSGNIQSTNRLKSIALTLIMNGSGKMHIEDSCANASVQLRGSGSIVLNGQAETQTISLSGSGSISASDFITKNADVHLSGSGSATIYATQNVYANLSGSGSIAYYGHPALVNVDRSGSGSVQGR